jgi:hypothetical protein
MLEQRRKLDLPADATGREMPVVWDVAVPFDRYEIVIRLGPDNQFLGVAGIRVKADFRSPEQRLRSAKHHDVDQFYQEA